MTRDDLKAGPVTLTPAEVADIKRDAIAVTWTHEPSDVVRKAGSNVTLLGIHSLCDSHEALRAELAEARRQNAMLAEQFNTLTVKIIDPGFRERAESAEARLRDLEAAQTWRPMERVPPKYPERVLIGARYDTPIAGVLGWVIAASLTPDDGWVSDDGEPVTDQPTHWMPLPPAPERGTEDRT